jgi:radical SAM protein (TIGR04043 family)
MKNRKLLVELQSYGARIIGRPLLGRKGGAGPAEGIILVIGGKPFSVPVESPYVTHSPYALKGENGSCWLEKNGSTLCEVEVRDSPKFYQFFSKDRIPFQKIALLHGLDCLASTVFQTCFLWGTSQGCKFCGIGLSLKKDLTTPLKKPEQLAEAAEIAYQLDGITHVTLTTGSTPTGEAEIKHLAACTRAIHEKINIPVHVQFLPPQDIGLVHELKDCGVATVGIHIESFDPDILAKVAPFKFTIGFDRYQKSWTEAVQIFGRNQVSSFVIVGLGESQDSVIEGCRMLAEMGVYPYVVPLRPIPGSEFETKTPPSPENMISIYEQLSKILEENGLSSKKSLAGCVRCGSCSSLSAFEA